MTSPRLRRWAAVGTHTVAGLLAGTGVAAAHVTVTPTQATQGGYGTFTFKVPNESATANTIKIEIKIPADTPVPSVSYQPVPGWTATTTEAALPTPQTSDDGVLTKSVQTVTFTADSGTKIAPGQFQTFSLSMGPLPEVDSISFPTDQTYDDGSVVNWADPTPEDGSEPEHPAPTVVLAASSGDGHDHPTTGATTAAATTGPSVTMDPQSAQVEQKSDTAARVLAVIGILVGALGLLVGAIGMRRHRAKS
jgi:uncharacterized protein YcnI